MESASLPEGWRPSEGDTLTGKVTSLDRGWSDWSSSFYPIVTIQTADGNSVNVHCFHHVLRTRMQALMPKPGDTLTITYLGQKDSKDGRRKVSMYTVESNQPQDASAFWGADMGQANRPTRAQPPAQGRPSQAELDEDIPF